MPTTVIHVTSKPQGLRLVAHNVETGVEVDGMGLALKVDGRVVARFVRRPDAPYTYGGRAAAVWCEAYCEVEVFDVPSGTGLVGP